MDRRRALGMLLAAPVAGSGGCAKAQAPDVLALPQPRLDGPMSVERALRLRRSVRSFSSRPLQFAELSQLLWAAQGVTGPRGQRTAPSAGALYPLTLYAAVGRVAGLPPGLYRYRPTGHALVIAGRRDVRAGLSSAAGQTWVAQAPLILVVCADGSRVEAKYGRRGSRFVDIEAGHAVQNVHLQAVALGLGSTDVGAFDPSEVKDTLRLAGMEAPLLLAPVGRGAAP
jgi:SagB-type dehydrogenase family enzyme